jgi:hypothetical protein
VIHGLVTQSSKTVSCVILEEVDWTRIQKNPVEMKTRQIWFPYAVISLFPRHLFPDQENLLHTDHVTPYRRVLFIMNR